MAPHQSRLLSMPRSLDTRLGNVPPTRAFLPSIARRQISDGVDLAEEDADVGRSAAETAFIIASLVIFAALLLGLFVIYKKKGPSGINPLSWWRHSRDKDAPSEGSFSSPNSQRAAPSTSEASSQIGHDEKENGSERNVVRPPLGAQRKESIMQKMQRACFGTRDPRAESGAVDGDMENGRGGNAAGESAMNDVEVPEQACAAPHQSVPTQSSMALGPENGQIKSPKQRDRPDASAFSWSTTTPVVDAATPASRKGAPLPPLPNDRHTARDTMLTTISEDSQPARYRTVSSWISNMQTRQEKRELHRQASGRDTARTPEEPDARVPTHSDDSSIRFSGMTDVTGMNTPTLQTAQMAWPVRQGPGEIEVPAVLRSGRRQLPQAIHQDQNLYDNGQPRQEESPQGDQSSQQPGDYLSARSYSTRAGAEYGQQLDDGALGPGSEVGNGYAETAELGDLEDRNKPPDFDENHLQDAVPEINIRSPSRASTIPEEDWIPPVTRYRHRSDATLSTASGSTTTAAPQAPAPAPAPSPTAAAATTSKTQGRNPAGQKKRSRAAQGKRGRGRRR